MGGKGLALVPLVIGNKNQCQLEKRVLNAVLFAASIATLVLLAESIMFDWGNFAIAALVAFCTTFCGLYVVSRKSPAAFWPIWVFLATSCIGVLYDWFVLAGPAMAAPAIIVGTAAVLPMVTPKAQLKWGVMVLATLYAFIAVGTFQSGFEGGTFHLSNSAKELLIETGLIAALLMGLTYLAVSSYRSEHARANEFNTSLQAINQHLQIKNEALEQATSEIKVLQGIIPICAVCKSIRNEAGAWNRLEAYISDHSNARFSHGYCPDCLKKEFPEEYDEIMKEET